MSHENAKPMVTDVFVKGAIQGWNIATHSTIPNVMMAFVIIRALNVSGALPLIGDLFSPLMGLFGLPGEAAAVLVAGWMSMGGGVGVAGGAKVNFSGDVDVSTTSTSGRYIIGRITVKSILSR